MGVTPIIPAPRDPDAEQQRDIERFERAIAQYLSGAEAKMPWPIQADWLQDQGLRWVIHSREGNGTPMLITCLEARASAYTGDTAETSANALISWETLRASAWAPS